MLLLLLLQLAYPVSPDSIKTPGDTLTTDTSIVCRRGYAHTVRNVSTVEKKAIYTLYGIHPTPGQRYEIDHLISLELGGSNSPKNLWPQPYFGPINAYMKDRLENYLHAQVCKGKIDLRNAQIAISKDWYQTYINEGLSK